MAWRTPKQWLGQKLVKYLSAQRLGAPSIALCQPDAVLHTLRKGDVLLVEGNTRFSVAIKYLTQSTWSHTVLCIKNPEDCATDEPALIEADINQGVRLLSVHEYTHLPTRICRPFGLTEQQIDQVIAYATAHLGQQYDVQKVADLVRYLIPKPPVPEAWRRRLLSFGSSDPTRAICSTLIAQAFLSIHYPILPLVDEVQKKRYATNYREWQRIRKHNLYAPRDFDISPYFNIIKPAPWSALPRVHVSAISERMSPIAPPSAESKIKPQTN